MFVYNEKTNLLERKDLEYPLQDVKEPNLYRALFSYSEIPKIAFNHRINPIDMPDEIWLTDTTFRDGQQSRTPYTAEQMVHIYDLIHRLGGPNGKIRQCEFFLYTKKDRDAVYKCLEKGYRFPEISTWIRASKKDFELAKSVGIKETGILVSCSDYHIFYKMHMTRRQAIDHYLSVVRECIETGIIPRCHFEDITRADFYGFVVPFATELMSLMRETGIPVKIRACDTMGYGVTFPGTVLPRSVQGLVYGLHHYGGVPHEYLEWHGHNDFYRSVINASFAWLYGAAGVNCSILGIGERTGNTPLEAMVIEYAQLRGTLDGMDATAITEIAEYFEKELHYDIPPMTPFVGKNFNVTRAGIHADGLLKNEEIYNIFDTEKLLNRPCRIAVSNTSGLAGVAHWINSFYRYSSEDALDKKHPVVESVKKWVDEQYEEGRVTVITDGELEEVTTIAMCGFLESKDPKRKLAKSIDMMLGRIVSLIRGNEPSFYLMGSVALNDFRPGWSDIDFLCLLKTPLDEAQAEALVGLRQKLAEEHPGFYFRAFEGAFLSLGAFLGKTTENLVYWGTSGQRITDSFDYNAVLPFELHKKSRLLYGGDVLGEIPLPTKEQINGAIAGHLQIIRKYAVKTDRSVYSAGWLFDIARCIFTLQTGEIISKTEAAEWALENNLTPNLHVLEKALFFRKNPEEINDEAFAWFEGLGTEVQKFADVLEKALNEAQNHS